jgi:hypothetical protein
MMKLRKDDINHGKMIEACERRLLAGQRLMPSKLEDGERLFDPLPQILTLPPD